MSEPLTPTEIDQAARYKHAVAESIVFGLRP
jgi:hypothetical protein